MSAPSSRTSAQANGRSSGWSGRGSGSHAHVVTVPRGGHLDELGQLLAGDGVVLDRRAEHPAVRSPDAEHEPLAQPGQERALDRPDRPGERVLEHERRRQDPGLGHATSPTGLSHDLPRTETGSTSEGSSSFARSPENRAHGAGPARRRGRFRRISPRSGRAGGGRRRRGPGRRRARPSPAAISGPEVLPGARAGSSDVADRGRGRLHRSGGATMLGFGRDRHGRRGRLGLRLGGRRPGRRRGGRGLGRRGRG